MSMFYGGRCAEVLTAGLDGKERALSDRPGGVGDKGVDARAYTLCVRMDNF